MPLISFHLFSSATIFFHHTHAHNLMARGSLFVHSLHLNSTLNAWNQLINGHICSFSPCNACPRSSSFRWSFQYLFQVVCVFVLADSCLLQCFFFVLLQYWLFVLIYTNTRLFTTPTNPHTKFTRYSFFINRNIQCAMFFFVCLS